MLDSNLMVGMKVKLLNTCDYRGKYISKYEGGQSIQKIRSVVSTEKNAVKFATVSTGNYVIGDNVELLELPRPNKNKKGSK